MKRISILIGLCAFLTGLLGGCGGGGETAPAQLRDPLDNWHLRNSLPQGSDLIDVAYGNGIFVALGSGDAAHGGAIFTSADGTDWLPVNTGTDSRLGKVIYGNGMFVAVGGHGAILTSADGINWVPGSSGTGADLYALTYGNGRFLAFGNVVVPYGHSYTVILASADGKTWIETNCDAFETNCKDVPGVGRVAFGNGAFVGINRTFVSTSADGIAWTSRTSGIDEYINDLTYGGGIFVAVGNGGGIYTSSDGSTWISRFPGGAASLRRIVYGNGTFVTVGFTGLLSPGLPTPGVILTSPDGITWTFRNNAGINLLEGIAYGNDTFIAVGGAAIYRSDPARGETGPAKLGLGIDHASLPGGRVNIPYVKTVSMKASGGAQPYSYSCAVTGGVAGISAALSFYDTSAGDASCEISGTPLTAGEATVFFFVRDAKDSASAGPLSLSILPSQDPLDNWHVRTSPQQGSGLQGVAYGNGMFVATGYHSIDSVPYVGPGTISTSPDGVSWTSGELGTALTLTDVAYGSGTFVVRGRSFDTDADVILFSRDGTTWTTANPGVDGRISLRDITYGNGTFVAVGSIQDNGLISGISLRSPDGAHWTPGSTTADAGGPTYLWGVTYGNGIFVAAGTYWAPSGPIAIIMTSPDGVAWTRKQIASSLDLKYVAYGNGIFVASGQGGVDTIMTSPDGISWSGSPTAPVVRADLGIGPISFGGGFFVAGGYAGALYTSPDGMTWTHRITNIPDLTGLTYGNGTFMAVTDTGEIMQSDPVK